MAKILPGLAVHKISGTIGGTTYQNWRGLLVARSKPTPTNVNTPRQTKIRSLITLLSRAWRDELNPGLRTAWNQRASSYPWLDVFGNAVKMSGINLYIKQNMVLLDHGLTRVDQPVAAIEPPEVIAEISEAIEDLKITVADIDSGVIASQSPFLDVRVAGGYLTATTTPAPIEVEISSLALPAGRKHQKSDFRHVIYYNDEIAIAPEDARIAVQSVQAGAPRNIVVSLQRFNKHGNFSQPILLSAVVTKP